MTSAEDFGRAVANAVKARVTMEEHAADIAAAVASSRTVGLTAFGGRTPVANRGQHGGDGVLSNGTDTQQMTFARFTLNRDVRQVSLVFTGWNWSQSGLTETDNLADLTIRAAVQTADNTIIPVYFGGSRDGILKSGGVLVTDPTTFVQAAGSTIVVRTYLTTTSGTWPVNLSLSSTVRTGEGYESGTAVTDKTLTGTVTTNAGTRGFGPSYILGEPRYTPLVAGIGDSILFGNGDVSTALGGTTDYGWFARAFSGTTPIVKVGTPGEKAALFSNWKLRRRRQGIYYGATHAVVYMGINDIRNGETVANIQAALTSIWSDLTALGMQVYGCTVGPRTTSTDAWATTTNQTPDTYNANRVAVNDWIRTTPAPLVGYIDLADVMESARNSGLWAVNGTASYATNDGLHPTSAMHILMAAAVHPNNFTI